MGKKKKKQSKRDTRSKKDKITTKPKNTQKHVQVLLPQEHTERIQRAERMVQLVAFEEALDEIHSILTPEIRQEYPHAYLLAIRIEAFAHANLKHYDKAVEAIMSLPDDDREHLDFLFMLTINYVQLQEYELAEDYAERYLKIYKRIKKSKTKNVFLAGTAGKVHELYFHLGLALRGQEKIEQSLKAFGQAYRAQKDYEQAYLEQARLYHIMEEDGEAVAVLTKALKAGVDTEEVRMLLAEYDDAPTISACMIVKDEEKFLPQCLDSIKDVVDEIIIVDTGSTDRTVEIAESYGAKVYFHPWENDFSKARNQSLQYPTRDWVFIIDADEELDRGSIANLKRAVTTKNHDLISIDVLNTSKNYKNSRTCLTSIRLFRREKGYRYSGIVHNQLKLPSDCRVLRASVTIIHYGYALDEEQMTKKRKRSEPLLLKQIDENPHNYFARFNLAQVYRHFISSGDDDAFDKTVEHASFVVENVSPGAKDKRHLLIMCIHQLSEAYLLTDRFEESLAYCDKALEVFPGYIDALFTRAVALYNLKRYDEAEQACHVYIDTADQYDPLKDTSNTILLHVKNQFMAYNLLGKMAMHDIERISDAQAGFQKAIDCNLKAIEYTQDFINSYIDIARAYCELGENKKAWKYIEKAFELDPENPRARYIAGKLHEQKKRYRQACQEYLQAYEAMKYETSLLRSLADCYRKLKDTDSAARYCRELVKIDQDDYQAWRQLGDIEFEKGRFEKAVEAYSNTITRNPDDLQSWNNLGNANLKLGSYARAEECYREALKLDESYALTRKNLIICLYHQDKYEDALRELEEYLSLAGDDYEMLSLAADIATRLRILDKAIGFYEKAITMNPKSADLYTNLGDCYYELGVWDAAQLGYARAVNVDPHHQPARDKLLQISNLIQFRKS
ncbi:MAG: tetratricopeptide repeat protein [candidate division Zixibacteria bacterium]|nr:tetratricopeptide repeat protein [candidate division Zixibacteria bacterium]